MPLKPSCETQKGCPSWVFFTLVCGLCTAFGNSYNPIPILVWLQPICLLLAVSAIHYEAARPLTYKRLLAVYSFILLTQVAGFAVAFGGFFNNPGFSAIGCAIIAIGGILIWTALLFVCVGCHVKLQKKFPDGGIALLAFPICWAAFWKLLSLTPIGVIFNPATALLESPSLMQSVSLFGVPFVVFLHGWVASVVSAAVHPYWFPNKNGHPVKSIQKPLRNVIVVMIVLLIFGGLRHTWEDFYQQDYSVGLTPTLQASCVVGPEKLEDLGLPKTHAWLINATKTRIEAGDDLIVWTEASSEVQGDEGEEALLDGIRAAQQSSHANRAMIAVTYLKNGPVENFNMMTMLAPNGAVMWRYKKAKLVPIVEARNTAGPGEIPIFNSETAGRIGGAICMDLELPDFLIQAGQAQMDLMIQPSFTWGPLSMMALNGERLRAIENGFGWFRCSSGGASAAISPYGAIHFLRRTGHDEVFGTQIPVFRHVPTLYANGGYLFGWAMVSAAGLVMLLAILPRRLANVLVAIPPFGLLLGVQKNEKIA